MSTQIMLACDSCRKYVTIGKLASLYADDRTMGALEEFVFSHQQPKFRPGLGQVPVHSLRITNEHDEALEHYRPTKRSDGGDGQH